MFVSNGWSGEYASGVWGKVNIGVGEEDLARILLDYATKHGTAQLLPAELTTTRVFQLLTWETDRLLAASLVSRVVDPQSQKDAIGKAVDQQYALLKKLTQERYDKEAGIKA